VFELSDVRLAESKFEAEYWIALLEESGLVLNLAVG